MSWEDLVNKHSYSDTLDKREDKSQKMLNIITRTSGRPNFFKICKHSIRSQTYPNINHIVIIDSNNDNTYVKDYDDIDKLIDIPEGKYQHFDAYLNEALEYIPKGELFCVMDDDDFYTEKTSLQKGVDTLTDGNVVFFRVVAAGGTVPSEQMMRSSHKELVFGQLSMLGFIMSTDFTYNKDNNLIKFPPKYGGDFGFINEVITQHYADEGMYNHPQIKWLSQVLASTNPVARWGKGETRDVNYDAAFSSYCSVSTCS